MPTPTSRGRKAASVSVLPFDVPAPFDTVLKTAVAKMGDLSHGTKTAAARVEKTVRSAAENVRDQAETLARDPRTFVDTMVKDGRNLRVSLRKNVVKVTDEMSREASRVADEVARRVSETVEGVVENSLHRMNVSTRDELGALTRKVDLLARKIDILKGAPAVQARRRTA